MRTQYRFPALTSKGRRYPILIAIGMVYLLGAIGWGAIRFYRRSPDETGSSPAARISPVWKEYSPPTGEFTVLMLGDPLTQVKAEGDVTLHLFQCREGTTQFEVSYVDADSRSGLFTPKMLLDLTKTTRATALQGDLTEERNVKAETQEGEEYVILHPKTPGMRDERSRIFLVGNRMFSFTVKGDNAVLHSPDVEKFFASIRFPKANVRL